MKNRTVILDADRIGELLVVLEDYHIQLNATLKKVINNMQQIMEAMDTCYYIGVIETHVKANKLSKDELELLEAWEKELYDTPNTEEIEIVAQFTCDLSTAWDMSAIVDEVAEFITNKGYKLNFIGETPDKQ